MDARSLHTAGGRIYFDNVDKKEKSDNSEYPTTLHAMNGSLYRTKLNTMLVVRIQRAMIGLILLLLELIMPKYSLPENQ